MFWKYLPPSRTYKTFTLPNNPFTPTNLRLTRSEDYCLLQTLLRIVGHFAPRSVVDSVFIPNPQLHLEERFVT